MACTPGRVLRYAAYSEITGVTIERETTFEQIGNGTAIRTQALGVGSSVAPQQKNFADLVRDFTTRWYFDFARFCDSQASRSS